mmetsp:Transcript_51601/g.172201  ORF Transcript_51601/g.172201 Transcript_51601/m.172201 type:complete len:204 (-) Transcript_51601:30-641(-)
MLSNDDVLDAIDLKVDYLMSPASLDEHGRNLIYVNHYELCAEHTLEQKEWWPFVHCMYGVQDCLNYNTTADSAAAGQTCAGAESGADDDLAIAGTDAIDADACKCSLDGAAAYCAAAHTSVTGATLAECAYSSQAHEWAVKSKGLAEAANGGLPLWVTINNMTLSLSVNEKKEITTWATAAMSAVCDHISLGGHDKPASCDSI